MNKVLIYLVGMVMGSGIMLAICELRPSPAIEELYSKYNHIQIYEDGSFRGQTIDGVNIEGCILDALCGMDMKENY